MVEPIPDGEDEGRQSDSFYLQFGKAMAAWATLERALSDWFRRSLESEDDKRDVNPDGIFYSARSFAGRADMLKAASASSLLTTDERCFLRKALKRATDYNTFRSKLAHRVTGITVTLYFNYG